MDVHCCEVRVAFAFPGYVLKPNDLLHFIEASDFTSNWSDLGLDDEDDLTGLQVCIMSDSSNEYVLDPATDLRFHIHTVDENNRLVTVLYFLFDDFGIAYLVSAFEGSEVPIFDLDELAEIRSAYDIVLEELNRVRRLKV